MRLLNLGCGQTYHKDWINIDFVSHSEDVKAYNLLNGIPIADNNVDVVYHSHVLEHFSKTDGAQFIKDCFRVLKPKGIIRIAIPDLEMIAREYLKNLELAVSGNVEGAQNYEWIKLEMFDQMVRNKSGGAMKEYIQRPNIPNETFVYERIGMEGKLLRESFLKNQNLDHRVKEKHTPPFFKRIWQKLKRKAAKIINVQKNKRFICK